MTQTPTYLRRMTALLPAAVVLCGSAAMACTPISESATPSQIRAQSERVVQDAQCRMLNGGVHDNLTLSAAEPVGEGRVTHAIGTDGTLVMVADCATREATILRGPLTESGETTCSPYFSYGAITGPGGLVTLAEGADLSALVDIAEARGASELNPVSFFFEFTRDWQTERHPVGRRDRFNLLCGCTVFYPDSAGGS